MNAYAERWVGSIKEECLSRVIVFGERVLRYALTHYAVHYHQGRPHQGMGNMLLMISPHHETARQGAIQCHERLGGLLPYYDREAA